MSVIEALVIYEESQKAQKESSIKNIELHKIVLALKATIIEHLGTIVKENRKNLELKIREIIKTSVKKCNNQAERGKFIGS